MQDFSVDLSLLSAMITPAVLISACGTLIFSTSARLGRIVDRVRELSRMIEELCLDKHEDFSDERREEVERQLAAHAQRGRLIQGTLTSFYIALGFFVAATVSIGVVGFVHRGAWAPSLLGIVGTVVLFYGCMLLIAETRLALHSINSEMAFVSRLPELYRERRSASSITSTTGEKENRSS